MNSCALSMPSMTIQGDDHVLVPGSRPLDIGDGDLAVHALGDGVEDDGRFQRLDIALALQGLLLGVHRVGDVDGQDEFDIDFDGAVPGLRGLADTAKAERGGESAQPGQRRSRREDKSETNR